ncbi:MAG: hydrolase family protein [Enterovirga sp.]|jgi:2-keto-4-pentenoate hydratase/2-oxohepta-3-ene-1,7-dioic acid hydratase in catechol pathway|nr:hydrolase family protein [Enterovirga sp.]
MKLVSFMADGRISCGAVVSGGIVDLGRQPGRRAETLREAVEGLTLAELNEAASRSPDLRRDQVRLLPPVPGRIICVGMNYREHALEVGTVPDVPVVFLRTVESLVGHEAPLMRPRLSSDMDFEGELAVVIGRGGRNIPRERALDHVFGYCCFNDGSIRDYQFKHSLTVGKNFAATGAVGPWIVTADETGDPSGLVLVTRVSGEEMQRSGIDDLIFDVPSIIAYLSAIMAIQPGDVIATGTPSGVGFARKPPRWLKPGDVVEVEISRVGTLRNPVLDEGHDSGAPA